MIEDTEKYRDKIATVDEQGKRIWIYPKKPKGWFTNARTYVSWVLLIILFGLPFIQMNGEPFVLFNILERNFIIFGLHFTPQDFYLFVLASLTFLVFIVLFTVIFGRLFCGWVCPQTIFMEMVFRKIEYWIEGDYTAQKRLDKAPWTTDKFLKKGAKHFIFILISIVIAHTFLSYILGLERVTQIVTENPADNFGGFLSMVVFTAMFYGVFSRLREQVCTTICPYGRLQGVLTDTNTILVSYDFVRGEPRGKLQKKGTKKVNTAPKPSCSNPCAACSAGAACKSDNPLKKIEEALAQSPYGLLPNKVESPIKITGDCIDCKLCVKVCPTGIDIRDGVQLECVNCTACMDACDQVMEKIDRPLGLIRYDSLTGIEEKRGKIFTPRVIAYTVVLVVMLIANVFLLSTRSDVEAVILRTPGMLYQKVDETHISNLYNYQIFNKTGQSMPLEFKLKTEGGRIKLVGDSPTVDKNQMVEGALFIEMDKQKLERSSNKIWIEIYSNGELMEEVKTSFLGPIK